MMDKDAIQKIIPHRPPFLFVDEITELENDRIVGRRAIQPDEYFFAGHFPGNPIMPGVLIVEALAQTGALLIMPRFKGETPVFMSIDNVKFRRMVKPGDMLVMEVVILNDRGRIVKMAGKASVNGEIACEAVFLAGIKPA